MKNGAHLDAWELIVRSKAAALSEAEETRLQQHLAACEPCRQDAAWHAQLLTSLLGSGEVRMDEKEKRAAFTTIGQEVNRARTNRKAKTAILAAVSLGVLLLAGFVILQIRPGRQTETLPVSTAAATVGATPTAAPEVSPTGTSLESATLPAPSGILTYTVQQGDFLFSIADEFGLKPESVLWSNPDVLNDNPHLIRPGIVLLIPPVDGLVYRWQTGDRLAEVAARFNVEPEAILEYPGNQMSGVTGNVEDISFEFGRLVTIPGGSRPIRDWGGPLPTEWP